MTTFCGSLVLNRSKEEMNAWEEEENENEKEEKDGKEDTGIIKIND